MKIKTCLLFIFALCCLPGLAQSPMEILKQRREKYEQEKREYNEGNVDTAHRYFYKTYEDYVNLKPVNGIKYAGKRQVLLGTESLLILENDEFVYKKIKELKYWGFIDEQGQLERIYDNHCYYTAVKGKLCYYLMGIDVEMKTDRNGNYSFYWIPENTSGIKDYMSEGLNGDIKDFNDEKFKNLTSSDPELFDQYKNEKPDPAIKDVRSQRTFKLIRYFNLFNTKM